MAQLPATIDALIFDLDGTLWDANNTYLQAWNQIIQTIHPELYVTLNDLKSVMGWEQKAAWNHLFPQLPDEEWQPMAKQIDIRQVELSMTLGGILYEGVYEGLNTLAHHYPLTLVSNCPEGLIPAFFMNTNLGNCFTDYEEHGRTHLSKAENIKLVMQRNHFKHPVYIGDTESDRKSAELAGVPFVYVSYGFGTLSKAPSMAFDRFPACVDYFLNFPF